MFNKIELLMPAGSLNKLDLAFDYGADAVYLGPPYYSLRARENEFQMDKLSEAFRRIHSAGKKGYLTLNIFARNRHLKAFEEDVKQYATLKPHAFIMSDPGLASIVKEVAPEVPIHLSVQANCMNWRSVQFWQRSLGVERIILSRELSILEIEQVKDKVPDMELEAFVHGSICIAYSGRCLLSHYMDYRDANKGVCDNSCREKYKLRTEPQYIEDVENHPGELYPIEEDEHGTYVLNAKDLCMIEHLEALARAGVCSFKVEGRTKSEFYSAMVARCYRGALNDLQDGLPFNPLWKEELNKLTNRGYHTAFMMGQPGMEGQNYVSSTAYNQKHKVVGIVLKTDHEGRGLVEIKNKLKVGQTLQRLGPDGQNEYKTVLKIESPTGQLFDEVHSGRGSFYVTLDDQKNLNKSTLLIAEA